jgi:hypothetical protein
MRRKTLNDIAAASSAKRVATHRTRVVRDVIPQSRKLKTTIVNPRDTGECLDDVPRTRKQTLQQIRAIGKKMFIQLPEVRRNLCGAVGEWIVSPVERIRDTKGGMCWWCTEPFEGMRHGCPVRYREQDDTMFMEGMFCSWNCAVAYAKPYTDGRVRDKLAHWIATIDRRIARAVAADVKMSLLEKEEYEKEVARRLHLLPTLEAKIYKPAPHWSCLQKFGGVLTIEQFRSNYATDVRTTSFPERMRLVPLGWATCSENLQQAAIAPLFAYMRDTEKVVRSTIYSRNGCYSDYGFPAGPDPYPPCPPAPRNVNTTSQVHGSTSYKYENKAPVFNPARAIKQSTRDQQQADAVQQHNQQTTRLSAVHSAMGIKVKLKSSSASKSSK